MLNAKPMVFVAGVFSLLAGSEAPYADGVGEYEKLKRDVEFPEAQTQAPIKKMAPAEQGLKPAAASVPQAKTEPPETHHPPRPTDVFQSPRRTAVRAAVSSQAEADPPAGESLEARDDLGVAGGSRQKQAEESRRALQEFLRGQGVGDGYVPKKDYEKLKREVEVLRTQMQSLLSKEAPAEQGLKPAAAPVPQAKTEPPETHQSAVSSQADAVPPAGEEFQAKDDLGVAEGNRKKEAEESRRALDEFLRGQKVLFKRGELELEFNLAYSHDSTENVCFDLDFGDSFCPDGSTVAPKFITRSIDTGLIARYGLADDLELDLTVPYGYIEQEQDFRPFPVPTPVRRTDSVGIGDISWALRYTAWHESGNIPNITLNLNAKSNTGDENRGLGTGFWNVGGGITLLKTIDPVVFFGSLGYTAVLEDGGIDPGDQIPYSFGTGFSLNDRVSFLGSLAGAAVRRTEVSGREIGGSAQEINTLQFSSTIQLTKRLFLEPFVAFGLTDEATDFVAGFSVPYRFEGRYPLPFFPD